MGGQELLLSIPCAVLCDLDENCLVKDWKNSDFSRVKRLAWFKSIYFSPEEIGIFSPENTKDIFNLPNLISS